MKNFYVIFPKLMIPVAAYWLIIGTLGFNEDDFVGEVLYTQFSVMGIILLVSTVILFLEALKWPFSRAGSIINLVGSVLVMIMALVPYLMVESFRTQTMAIIWIMTLLDVIAGIVVMVIATRRDFSLESGNGLGI